MFFALALASSAFADPCAMFSDPMARARCQALAKQANEHGGPILSLNAEEKRAAPGPAVFDSCAEVKRANPLLGDGQYHLTAYNLHVYCHNMAMNPTEFLSLQHPENNYAKFVRQAGERTQEIIHTYTKLRFDPLTLMVDIGDATFSYTNETDGPIWLPEGNARVVAVSYGVAGDCIDDGIATTSGRAKIDLTGTGMVLAQQFYIDGFEASGEVRYDANSGIAGCMDKQCAAVFGGGYCGWVLPGRELRDANGSPIVPVNGDGGFHLRLAIRTTAAPTPVPTSQPTPVPTPQPPTPKPTIAVGACCVGGNACSGNLSYSTCEGLGGIWSYLLVCPAANVCPGVMTPPPTKPPTPPQTPVPGSTPVPPTTPPPTPPPTSFATPPPTSAATPPPTAAPAATCDAYGATDKGACCYAAPEVHTCYLTTCSACFPLNPKFHFLGTASTFINAMANDCSASAESQCNAL